MKEKQKNKIVYKKVILASIISLILLFVTILLSYSVLTKDNLYAKDEKRILIPIFVYHNLIEPDQEVKLDYMETTTARFEEQVQGLLNFGYEIIDYEDLIAFNNGEKKLPKKVALITFDDGNENNYTLLYPIVKKYQIPVAINIIDDTVGTLGSLSWDQIKEMKESGLITFCSHSKDHQRLNEQELDIFLNNTDVSFKHLEENLGKDIPKIFTYPYGLYTDEKIEELKEKNVIQNLTDNKINNSNDLDLSRLHRSYPLNDSIYKMLIKIYYRDIRYGGK